MLVLLFMYDYDDKRYFHRSTKVDKNLSKNTQKSAIMDFFFSIVLFVAMQTRHMNLQSILFLNHEIQGLLFMYDHKRYLYQSTKVVIFGFQTAVNAIFEFWSSVV